MERLYGKLIGHSVFANVILAAIVVTAVMAGALIKREHSPHIEIPFVEVTVEYPGAAPMEVESGVTRKVEAAVESVVGIRRHFTTSSEGRSIVSMEIADGFDARDVKDAIRNAVDGITDLPAQAERPMVRQVEDDEAVIWVMVSGVESERQRKVLVEDLQSDIEALPEVSLTDLFGVRDYEINVEVSQDGLERTGLTVTDIADAIRRNSQDASAGTLELEGESVRLRTYGDRHSDAALADVIVKSSTDGQLVRVGDIATVHDSFVEERRHTTFRGEPAAAIIVEKAPGEDAIAISEAVTAFIATLQPTLPPTVTVQTAFDNTFFIRSQINMITGNGLIGLALVLVVLWLFLEPKLAFWVAMGIPISLGGSLILLLAIGGSLNQISLIGMIVVMGIIVDDAIVVGESIFVHRKSGKRALQASVDGVREVALPVLASVSTTIAAFLPLMFIPGLFGQFAKHMPYVIITALIVSLVECFFLLPAHLNHTTQTRVHPKGRSPLAMRRWVSEGLERGVERYYVPLVRKAVDYRYVTLCGAVAIILVAAGLVGGGFVSVVMWPGVESDFAEADIEFAPGTPPEVLFDAVQRMERAAMAVAERQDTKNGKPFLRHLFANAPRNDGTTGHVSTELIAATERSMTASEFMAEWSRELGEVPGALAISFEGAQVGGGMGEDIEYWLTGDDVTHVRAASEDFKAQLIRYEGVYSIQDNFRPGKKEIEVRLKPAAGALGLTLDDLNRHLYAGYYGDEAFRIQRGREDVRVKVRYPKSDRETIDSLYASRIETPGGAMVPFRSVADVSYREGVSTISGINGVRGVRVSAAVDENRGDPVEINADIVARVLPEILREHPGIEWSSTGAAQENQEMLSALSRNTTIALMAIFVILCTIFRSYVQPFIIMLVIPYGIVGALLGHMVLGLPLSFLSIGGITALCGVLVNDSIVLIERANTNIAEGMKLEEAVCRAGQRRFRAILLTSLSTCVGLAPLILETDLQAQVVIPMAVSIASGVAFGTLLTLILIPAFLMIMNDARRTVHRIVRGQWVEPESVEPARTRSTAMPQTLEPFAQP